MPSFMDYYNQELAKRGHSVSPVKSNSSAPTLGSIGSSPDGGDPNPQAQSPINWIFDIIDRPRRAVENTLQGYMSLGEAVGNQLGGHNRPDAPTIPDAIGEILSGSARGLFSTDPKDQKPTGQIIEESVDRVGKYDPTYKDEKFNVHPLIEGGAGMLGDIVLDPLMYVPGAALLKGAKTVAGAADKGLSAASKALFGGRKAEQAATAAEAGYETVAKGAKKAKKSKLGEENPFEGINNLDPNAFRPSFIPDSGKVVNLETIGTDLEKAQPFFKPAQSGPARPAGVIPRLSLEEGAQVASEAAPKAPKIVPPKDFPKISPDVLDESGAIPVGGATLEDLIRNSPNNAKISEVLTGLADDVSRGAQEVPPYNVWANQLPPNYVIRDPSGASVPVTVAKLRDDLARFQDKSVKPSLKPQKEYLDRTLSFLRRDYQTHAAQSAGASDPMAAFVARAAANESKLKNALGDDLYDYLRKVNTPARFQKALENIRNVIEPTDSVADTFRNMDQNLARLLSERLGVPRAVKPHTEEEARVLSERLLSNNDPYWNHIAQGLAKSLDAELTDLASKGYVHYLKRMGMDVARTSKSRGQGLGRYVDQLNGFSQYTMLRNAGDAIESAALDVMRARGIKGNSFRELYSKQRTDVYREAAMRVMEDQARLLDDIGAHMSIGVGDNTVMLSQHEVYRAIEEAANELGMPHSIEQALFNTGTQAAPTAVTDAVAAAVAGKSRDEVYAILTDPKKFGNKGLLKNAEGERPNNLINTRTQHGWASLDRGALSKIGAELTGGDRKAADNLFTRRLESGRTSARTGTERKTNSFYLKYISGGRNYLAEGLTDAIMQSRASLKARAVENELAFTARTRQEAKVLTEDELAKIESFLKDPSGTVTKIRAWKARQARLEAEASRINASPDAEVAAEHLVDAAVGPDIAVPMDAAAKAQTKASSAGTALALRDATDTFTDDVWEGVVEDFRARPFADTTDPVTGLRPNEEWAQVVDEGTPLHGDWRDMLFDDAEEAVTRGTKKTKKGRKGKFVDLSQDAPAMIDSFGQKITDPYGAIKNKLNEWFNQNYRASSTMPIAHAWQNSMSMHSAYVNHQLNAIAHDARKAFPETDILPSVFEHIQKGVKSTDPKVADLEDKVTGLLSDFFDVEKGGSMGNVFLRTTADTELVNAMFKQKGLDFAFDLDEAQKVAKAGGSLDAALSTQWKDWTVKDPLDFLHRLSQARYELAFNRGTAQSFLQMAKDLGAVSKKPGPGFVRIVSTGGRSRFSAYLPKDIYVKRELADELQRVETVFRTSREFQGQLGDFVRTTYAPLLNAWKYAITLPRPGHHIRNLIGDTSVTWMRRGTRDFTQSWKDAVKLLASRNNYQDVNMLEAATRYGIKDIPKGGDVLIKGGKYGDFTADELYATLAEAGGLPSYHIGEDFLDASGKLNSVLGKITLRDSKLGTALGGLSEGRDHLARFQHLAQAIRQEARAGKYANREALLKAVTAEVSKYHPDASLLTPFESKLRLAIPFYSWFGKIVPALVESMVMHPGRLSAFNKASYNWATAAGLDPESLTDPFPNDQLFPSFITEQALGPQFQVPGGQQYIRMNPGLAHLDVFNTLGGEPIRGLAGMTSPLLRVPAELLSGGSWGTGGQINDWSDYLDQSIPGVNYLSNVSGVSPTGSVDSLLRGQGLDPQQGFEKGSKSDFDRYLSIANWISGLGFQNLSRPNYINFAEIEKRNQGSDK